MTQMVESAISPIVVAWQVSNIFDKIYALCIKSKSAKVVKRDKYMTPMMFKFKEVYIDLWGSYDPLFQSGSMYVAILICKYTQKT